MQQYDQYDPAAAALRASLEAVHEAVIVLRQVMRGGAMTGKGGLSRADGEAVNAARFLVEHGPALILAIKAKDDGTPAHDAPGH